MTEHKRAKFVIELDLSRPIVIRTFPCGMRLPMFIILEDIWQETGCDVPGEKGAWICPHCDNKYFFYLFSSQK